MRCRRPLEGLLILIMALMETGNGAQLPEMAALVLEVRGANVPGVAPYTELPVGKYVKLPGGTTLLFLHYTTCRIVSVIGGGTLTLRAQDYQISRGAQHSVARTPCPRRVILPLGGEVAGSHMREIGPGVPSRHWLLSTRPRFVLVGPRANAFVRVRLSKLGPQGNVGDITSETVLEASLKHRRLRWPKRAASLDNYAIYKLAFEPKANAQIAPVEVTFMAMPSAANKAVDALTLIQVE
jgi:hypothetical protein